MRNRLVTAGVMLALASGCAGAGGSSAVSDGGAAVQSVTRAGVTGDAATHVVVNPGFETGSLSPWTSCGSAGEAAVSTAQAHAGTYSALIGSTAKPEVNGTAGVCQTVTVPAAAVVWWQDRAWVYQRTEPDKFVRVEIATDLPAPGGGYIVAGMPHDVEIVTSGAQLLLSEEFRSQIQVDEDD